MVQTILDVINKNKDRIIVSWSLNTEDSRLFKAKGCLSFAFIMKKVFIYGKKTGLFRSDRNVYYF